MIEPTEEPEYCKCSECGYVNLIVEVFALDGYHYCPNCGAKMERNEDGTDL
jgi:predicted nucleic acid-binding Zn ribbon protein